MGIGDWESEIGFSRERQRSTERGSAERSPSKPHAEVRTGIGELLPISDYLYQ